MVVVLRTFLFLIAGTSYLSLISIALYFAAQGQHQGLVLMCLLSFAISILGIFWIQRQQEKEKYRYLEERGDFWRTSASSLMAQKRVLENEIKDLKKKLDKA